MEVDVYRCTVSKQSDIPRVPARVHPAHVVRRAEARDDADAQGLTLVHGRAKLERLQDTFMS
jgi:hypothetical protein